MSAPQVLFDAIEPDEETPAPVPVAGRINTPSNGARAPVVLTPTNMATTQSDAESGIAGILRQSSHPMVMFFLYLFRIAAITVYLFFGLFTNSYVLSTVVVVVLLAMDFWNCRNVAGRRLVGLRYWNQVDDDGESYWVFESRDPSRPANPIDSKMFWIAIYIFPVLWTGVLILSIIRFSLFVPIVLLALVFNVTNAVGFTYADRDAKQRWAQNAASAGWNMGMGGLGGQLLGSAVKNSVGRVFGA
ncbi:Golgi apparatus membrane protein TVP23 [Rickenella mellea]|uniref:Golgi apparatus membrane protein TVP23 n=1 Tax=Rickenella mellea TaxID=50990 RepID=A0A4Y7QMI1_9AGAM|nr:Golgi apparatus membrane protein TVP23 [Rickenella mellea]